MSTKTGRAQWTFSIVAISFSAALLVLAAGGCTSLTAPGAAFGKATTGPGTPDEVQLQHHGMVKTAIEAKAKNDALAALALLQADISRWRVNWAFVAMAYMDVSALTDIVNKEDWDLASKKFQELHLKYRGQQ